MISEQLTFPQPPEPTMPDLMLVYRSRFHRCQCRLRLRCQCGSRCCHHIGVGSGVGAGLSANVSDGGKDRRRNFESVLVTIGSE